MTPEYARLRLRDDDRFREELCDWIRANGLEPDNIPAGATIVVANGRIATVEYVRADGGLQVDPHDSNALLTRAVTVPLRVEPNSAARQYITNKCPTCGR